MWETGRPEWGVFDGQKSQRRSSRSPTVDGARKGGVFHPLIDMVIHFRGWEPRGKRVYGEDQKSKNHAGKKESMQEHVN